jgi:hypothetical protein
MTTKPVGTARVLAIHVALTTASCPARVRIWPVSVTMSCWVSAFTSLPSGTAADSPSPGGNRPAGRVSYEL